MGPARVSSPQVDLTRSGLDETPTLLILHCLGATRSARGGEEVQPSDACPCWQSRGKLPCRNQKSPFTPLSNYKSRANSLEEDGAESPSEEEEDSHIFNSLDRYTNSLERGASAG